MFLSTGKTKNDEVNIEIQIFIGEIFFLVSDVCPNLSGIVAELWSALCICVASEAHGSHILFSPPSVEINCF